MKHTEYGHSISFISQNWESYPRFMHAKEVDSKTVRALEKVGESSFDKSLDRDGQPHDDRNTWNNWHLIPSSRPTFAMPAQKINSIEIPGTDGDIDLSYELTKYPTFSNREGSFEFIVENDFRPWNVLYSEIAAFLHGQRLRCVLEDDPEYYYEGRFRVEAWNSSNDGTYSRITIGYSVKPYKTSILSSADDWLWDPFNFYTGIIPNGIFRSQRINSSNADLDLALGSLDESSSAWTKTIELTGNQGKKPQVPTIYWAPILGSTPQRNLLTLDYVNNSIGINYNRSGYKILDPRGSYGSGSSLSSINVECLGQYTTDIFGQTPAETQGIFYPSNVGPYNVYMFKDNDFILYDAYMRQNAYVKFRGQGYLTIDFNRGEL